MEYVKRGRASWTQFGDDQTICVETPTQFNDQDESLLSSSGFTSTSISHILNKQNSIELSSRDNYSNNYHPVTSTTTTLVQSNNYPINHEVYPLPPNKKLSYHHNHAPLTSHLSYANSQSLFSSSSPTSSLTSYPTIPISQYGSCITNNNSIFSAVVTTTIDMSTLSTDVIEGISLFGNTPDLRWIVNSEQKTYYLDQFLSLESNYSAKLNGAKAKTYFELSKLNASELCKIWELVDIDRDGQLTLGEFCAAMHLVVLRRNGIPIPSELPQPLHDLIQSNVLATKCYPENQSELESSPTTTNQHMVSRTTMTNHGLDNDDDGSDNEHAILVNHVKNLGCSNSPTNNVKYRHKHRRSVSSQSDICSLGEGMIMFESKLIQNPQLKYPIPVRLRNMLVPSDTLSSSSSSSVAKTHVTNISHYNYETKPLAYNYEQQQLNQSHLCPPRPPPRVYQKLINGLEPNFRIMDINKSNETQDSHIKTYNAFDDDDHELEVIGGKITNNIDKNRDQKSKTDNNKSASPKSPSKLSLNPNDLESPCPSRCLSPENWLSDQTLINLKQQCDEVSQINDHLSITLMKLQKDRISMKILMERLMPLNTC